MKKIIIILSIVICAATNLAHADDANVSQQIQLLNSQIQAQFQKIKAEQQNQIKTLNSKVQAQLKQMQTDLQTQIQKANALNQDQIKQLQTSFQQQLNQVHQEATAHKP